MGKVNELGAEIAREDGDKVLEGIRGVERFTDTDAFFLVDVAAGGTGSGTVAVLTQQIKEAYPSLNPSSLFLFSLEDCPGLLCILLTCFPGLLCSLVASI